MATRQLFRALPLALLALACGEEVVQAPPTSGSTAPSAQPATLVRGTPPPPKPSAEPPPAAVEFQETDFAEGERSRDPFRSFAKSFADEARSKVKSQREVVLDQYAVDELKLVGIVTRIQP